MKPDKSSKAATAKRTALTAVPLSAKSRNLLQRFMTDWVYPRWRQILLTLALTAILAATTGAYPMIIKTSFDTLMQDKNSGALPLVLVAIIGTTMLRSLFLYLQTVATNKIVMRMTTDLQKAGFAHLIGADFARFIGFGITWIWWASIQIMPKPMKRGRRRRNAPWTMPICAISLFICTGCSTQAKTTKRTIDDRYPLEH